MTPQEQTAILIKKIQEEQERQAKLQEQTQGTEVDLSQFHIHFGLPAYGGQLYLSTMLSILQFTLLATQNGLRWSMDTMTNESLVTRARNNLMAKMLTNKDATHFMFIDSDISFNAEDIIHMLISGKDIVAGMYPKKTLPIQYNVNLGKDTKVNGPFFTVDTAATGFLMFTREVYENLIKAHPETKYLDDVGIGKQYEPNMYAIFDVGIDADGHYLSEDWNFCRRAKALGYDIWADSRVKLTHTGTHAFVGNTDLLQLKPKAKITITEKKFGEI